MCPTEMWKIFQKSLENEVTLVLHFLIKLCNIRLEMPFHSLLKKSDLVFLASPLVYERKTDFEANNQRYSL